MKPHRIVSGGQTGADRAGIDWAIARGVPHGGWCPKGRKAEDGPLPGVYQLVETRTANYAERTKLNVRDSDGTVVFTKGLSPGSRLTINEATRLGRPCLVLDPERSINCAVQLADFCEKHRILVLNVAGSRASTDPGLYGFVRSILDLAFD